MINRRGEFRGWYFRRHIFRRTRSKREGLGGKIRNTIGTCLLCWHIFPPGLVDSNRPIQPADDVVGSMPRKEAVLSGL